MNVYRFIEDFNTDNLAARRAYRADMAVQSGVCAVCQHRPKDGHMRRCWTCRHVGVMSR